MFARTFGGSRSSPDWTCELPSKRLAEPARRDTPAAIPEPPGSGRVGRSSAALPTPSPAPTPPRARSPSGRPSATVGLTGSGAMNPAGVELPAAPREPSARTCLVIPRGWPRMSPNATWTAPEKPRDTVIATCHVQAPCVAWAQSAATWQPASTSCIGARLGCANSAAAVRTSLSAWANHAVARTTFDPGISGSRGA